MTRVLAEDYALSLGDWVVPVIEKMLSSPELSVVRRVCGGLCKTISLFSTEDRGTYVLTAVLGLVHDEDSEFALLGMTVLREIVPFLDMEVTLCFVLPEIMAKCEDNSTQIKCLAVDCFPQLLRSAQEHTARDKILATYAQLVENEAKEVKIAAAKVLGDLLSACDEGFRSRLLHIFTERLTASKDSKGIMVHQALGVLANSSAPFPQELTEIFSSLSRDQEIQDLCALHLPKILQSGGAESWGQLQDSFLYMARSGSVKAKLTLAQNIHKISQLIGPARTREDILTVYQKMLNVKHPGSRQAAGKLSKILSLLEVNDRPLLLTQIQSMQKTRRDWRTRLTLARQMKEICVLYPVERIETDLWPVLLTLMGDLYEKVRETVAEGVGTAIRVMAEYGVVEIPSELVHMAFSDHYKNRQFFVFACRELRHWDMFVNYFGGIFEELCHDRVANIRISCAAVLSHGLPPGGNENFWEKLKIKLTYDPDPDVRYEITKSYEDRGISDLVKRKQQIMPPMFRTAGIDDTTIVLSFESESPPVFDCLGPLDIVLI